MKIELTQEQLDAVVETLEFAQARCEQEAAAMFCANDLLVAAEGREAARRLGQYRLEQAGKAAMLAEFFLNV